MSSAENLSMDELLRRASVDANARGHSLRWLADRSPHGRILTREELFIYAREAEQFAAMFSSARAALGDALSATSDSGSAWGTKGAEGSPGESL